MSENFSGTPRGACSVGTTKFRVRVRDETSVMGGDRKNSYGSNHIKQIIGVSPPSIGEEGTMTFLEQGGEVTVPDRKRKIPPLVLTLRVDSSNEGLVVLEMFKQWYDNRHYTTKSIYVDIIRRNGDPLFTFDHIGCTFQKMSLLQSLELASAELLSFEMTFLPFDVKLQTLKI